MPNLVKRHTTKPTVSKTTGIQSKIVPLVDLPTTGIKCLLYGRSKSGKTTLAASSADHAVKLRKKVLLISFETGKMGGAKSLGKHPGIDFLQVVNTDELTELINHGTVLERYMGLILDTVTQLEAMVLAEILGIDKLPEQKSWGMASREQYGQLGLQTKTFLKQFCDIPQDVWFLGQERQSEPREDSEIITPSIGVQLSPTTAGWLNAQVDYIGHTFIRRKVAVVEKMIGGKKKTMNVITDDTEFCLRVGPDPVYNTGFRKPKRIVLPDVLVDPSYQDIVDLIDGKFQISK